MKLVLVILVSAVLAVAGEISVVVKADNGQTVSTVTLAVSDTTLKALNDWRLVQTKPAANPNDPPVLTYPTTADLWRQVLGGFIRSVVGDYLDAVKVEQAKIDAAKAEIERLRETAVQ